MSDQRNFARTVVALSSVVVAGCAVAVTIKVMSTDPQPRVLDQDGLERQVMADIQGGRPGPADRLSCPASVVADKGNKFECRYWDADLSTAKFVEVEVVSDQGKVSAAFLG
ncbi:DUF4333 domain-containing protein [Streptomyces sp. NPDC001508]|uniref:DUF4333 domain-containing protein n=1 Tax=Streptomyces sp. NPDC001508 TaxID=3154656 RepID=UPI00331E4ABF